MLMHIARWIVNAAALLLVAYMYSGVHVTDFWAALIAALTLGLFLFVINALMFWLVAEVVHGFTVDGFMAALIGSILYSILTLITSWLLFSKRDSK